MRRSLTSLLVSSSVLLAAGTAFGVPVPDSDALSEIITNHHGADVLTPAGGLLAFPTFHIPETTTAEPATYDFIVPAVTIFLTEPGQSTPSDYLRIGQYTVHITSNGETPLAPRTGITTISIPTSANEAFLPWSVFVHSDGDNPTNPNTSSDEIKIIRGYHGEAAPDLFTDVFMPEPLPEGAPEAPFHIVLPAAFFNILDAEGISDYVDVGEISVDFVSSDNPADYQGITANAFVVEDGLPGDPFYGGDINYSLGFVSDSEVPEPASLGALAFGGMALLLRRRRA